MEKYKTSYKNNKFKISTQIWNEECELPDISYSVLDIQVSKFIKNMDKILK